MIKLISLLNESNNSKNATPKLLTESWTPEQIKQRWYEQLPKAVKFWQSWLGSSVTAEKYAKNYPNQARGTGDPGLAYILLKDAIKPFWVDQAGVINACKYITSADDFKNLNARFADGETGYKSFTAMINGEFKNKKDQPIVGRIADMLINAGVIVGGGYPPTFKVIRYSPVSSIHRKELMNLSNSIKSLQLIFYNNSMNKAPDGYPVKDEDDAGAFVRNDDNRKIYVNITYPQSVEYVYTTLVHEIQHIIYNIQPLNPKSKIDNVFLNRSDKPKIPTIQKTLNSPNIDYKKASQRNGISDVNVFKYWSTQTDELIKKDPGYACRATEKMSNIMAVRALFKLSAGQDITRKMLEPYIYRKKDDGDISLILICWATRGFPNLDTMLKGMNDLAAKGQDKTIQQPTIQPNNQDIT